MSADPRDELIEKMERSLHRIEVRLVGDRDLQSNGLVQDVNELKLAQMKTAEILERVVVRLDELEKARESQERVNRALFVSAGDVKRVKRWLKAACLILPPLGGAVTWAYSKGWISISFLK